MSSVPEQIIIRFLQGRIGREEEEILNNWLCEDDRNAEIFRQYIEIWDSNKPMPEEEINAGWNKLHKQIAEIKPKKKSKIIFGRWLPYAAILCGIILGTVVWYNFDKKDGATLAQIVIENSEGTLKHTLPDNSIAWLHGKSQISYTHDFAGKERDVLLLGDAYFEVRKDESKAFVVSANNLDVKVTGTEFMLQSVKDSYTTVTLITGGVDVNTRNKRGENTQQIQLTPGQQAKVDLQTGTTEISVIDTDFYKAWKNGTYRFDDESLETVIKQLSFWYNVEIDITENIKNEKITGRVKPQHSIDAILENIGEVSSVRFRKTGEKKYIGEKN